MRRVHVDPELIGSVAPDEVTLPDEASHYLGHVLRLAPGDLVELFDGTGRLFTARVLALDPVRVAILETRREPAAHAARITLLQAIPKGDRWDYLIEKATELGVDAIVPLETRRTVVRIPPAKLERRQARWEKIAAGAARQCGRPSIPEIAAPQGFAEALAARDEEVQLLARPGATRHALEQALADDPSSIAIWIGPEGGFDPEEVALLESVAAPISLGPYVLRSETAGAVAVALVRHLVGAT